MGKVMFFRLRTLRFPGEQEWVGGYTVALVLQVHLIVEDRSKGGKERKTVFTKEQQLINVERTIGSHPFASVVIVIDSAKTTTVGK